MIIQNLTIVHADTNVLGVSVTKDDAVVNISGYSIWMTAKTAYTDADPGIFQLSSFGYQECGLSGKTTATATGLSISSTYYFKVTKDGGAQTEKSITTASDTTYGAVITLMNAQMTGALLGCVWSLVDGDLRCTSPTTGGTSSIALAAGSSGTDLFATLTGFSSFDTGVAGGDIQFTDPTNGKATITILPIKTSSLSYQDLTYVYDIQAKDTGGVITTVCRGQLTILADVTRTS